MLQLFRLWSYFWMVRINLDKKETREFSCKRCKQGLRGTKKEAKL